jgi:hypothetical protein
MKSPRGVSAIGTFIGFILIIVLLGMVWVSTGGPSRPISQSGWFLTPPSVPGIDTKTGHAISSSESQADTSGIPSSGGSSSSSSDGRVDLLSYFFNYRTTTGGLKVDSPYASQVALSRGTATSDDKNKEYVTISTSRKLQNPVTLTGWVLESKTQAVKVTLGSAAQIPALGDVSGEAPITVGADMKVYLITGRSPIGASFRTNACAGYFEQHQNFSPQIRTDCPAPEDEALLHPEKTGSSVECVDFIENLPACSVYTGSFPADVNSSCQSFVQNDLTYAGCIQTHRNDPDFYGDEWYVYLSRDQELWANSHDQILLWDENGKLVASVIY